MPLVQTPPSLREQVEQAIQGGAEIIELRVDRLGDIEAVEHVLRLRRGVPFVVTVRCAEEGGAWDGDEAERVALIERLGLRDPGFIDFEYAAWIRSANVRQKIGLVAEGGMEEGHEATGQHGSEAGEKKGAGQSGPVKRAAALPAATARPKNQLILSHHDLRGTPADLDAVFDKLTATPAAIIKAVFTARDARDALRVLEQLHKRRGGRQKIIALAMGEAGIATRVLARKFGAFLTFAALERGAESAPGQLTLLNLISDYAGWQNSGAETRVYGVVGWPVKHSRSPYAHNRMMDLEHIDGLYVPLPVPPDYEAFAAFMDYVAANAWLALDGLSVTLPHKEHALRWLDARRYVVTSLARRCGAVNTLTRLTDGGWEGDNTDVAGVWAALESVKKFRGDGLRGRRSAILGAGGAARAAALALLERGGHVTVYNRTPERARFLARELNCDWKDWEARAENECEILVNCTRVGLWPEVEDSPMPPKGLNPGMTVLDTIYNPPETRLLRDAQARGCRALSGWKMFIGQAIGQYTRWHGRPPSRKVLKLV